MSEPELRKNSDDMNAGSGDANEMQRAIRARALHTVQRRPPKFWYTSPPRLVAAIVLAAVLVTVIGVGIDKCLQAFHTLVTIYASQPKRSAPPPPAASSEDSGVIYVRPDPSIPGPEQAPAKPPDSKK